MVGLHCTVSHSQPGPETKNHPKNMASRESFHQDHDFYGPKLMAFELGHGKDLVAADVAVAKAQPVTTPAAEPGEEMKVLEMAPRVEEESQSELCTRCSIL